jgi:hypothetical protein
MPPEVCPNCGAEVPPHARACPECGSDEQTGWSDDAYTERLGIPDEKFDYDEFVRRELEGRPPPARPLRWLWLLVAVLLLIGFLVWFI